MKKVINKIWLLLVVALLAMCGGCKNKSHSTVDSATKADAESDITQEQESTKNNSGTKEDTTNEEPTSVADEEETTEAAEEETTEAAEEETTEATEEETTKATEEETTATNDNEKPTTVPSTGGETNNELDLLVNNIVANNIKSSMSQLEKVLVIHDYLTYNVDYDYDNYLAGNVSGSSYTALGTLKNGRAVCSGYAYAFYELAKAAGIDVKYISGTADNNSGNGYQGHAWNQVKIDGVWYNVDTTWDDPTYESKDPNDHSGNNYTYFLISDATIEKDHRPDSADKASCSKDYDMTAIIKAVADLSENGKVLYADTESELTNDLIGAINSGHEEFVLYMPGDTVEGWELIDRVFTTNQKTYRVSMSSYRSNIGKYCIEKADNVYCVTSVADLKNILDNNQNNIEQILLWYYDDEMTESNAGNIINAALAKAGYSAKLSSSSDVMNGMIKCYVSRDDDICIINNISEFDSLINRYSKEEIQSKTIMYTGETVDFDQIGQRVHAATISKGYYMLGICYEDYYGITEINLGDPRDCIGVENLQNIVDNINTEGIEKSVGKNFIMYMGDSDANSIYIELSQKLYDETGHNFHITYNITHKYIVIMIEG